MSADRLLAGSAVIGRDARTDHCPGLLVLHDAEDGHLARVRLPGGRISASQLEAVAEAASFGNGLIDITVRANLQLRGLPSDGSTRAAERLAAAGLLPSETHERARNVLASPFAGRHPVAVATTDELVVRLDRELCADPELSFLPGRFVFAIDDGAGLLLGQQADVTLLAERDSYRLIVAGVPTMLRVSAARAAATALEAARAFLRLRADETIWRVRELAGGAEAIAVQLDTRTEPDRGGEERPGAVVPGVLEQADGRMAVTGLAPLGRLNREAAAGLAVLVREHGSDARLSPWRTVTIVDVAAAAATSLARSFEQIGLSVSPVSGWHRLSACAGLGACPKALVDVRAAAERRAALRSAASPAEHWSACERRCGEPRGVPLSIVATTDGLLVKTAGAAQDVASVDDALALLAIGSRS